MRRTREESQRMDKNILELFENSPESRLVENRYRTISALLRPQIEQILKDAISYDRKIRLFTEGEEQELKDTLEAEFITENL